MRGAGIELARVGLLEAAHVAREFDAGGLHAKTDAKVRDAAFAGVVDGLDHTFDAALAEAARHQDAVEAFELVPGLGAGDALGLDPVDVGFDPVRPASVNESFLQALVGILVFDVLADQADIDLVLGVAGLLHHGLPASEVARARFELHEAENDFVHALGREHDGAFVDRLHVAGGNDGPPDPRRRTARFYP